MNRLASLKKRWKVLLALISPFIFLNIYFLFTVPSNDGPWLEHYSNLAKIDIKENQVNITNFRRARYDLNGQTETVEWFDRTLNLDNLHAVWYGISVFESPGLAHTFLSFDFGTDDPVVISVEARMRPGQSYHPLEGALDNYHLIYVVADERDVIDLRVNKRLEEVYFIPINVNKDRIRAMFLDIVKRVNSLAHSPDFYNTFTSNCTNSIMKDTKVPAWQYYLDPRIILPGYSDRIAYDYGVLQKGYSREAIRNAAQLDPGVTLEDDPDFSRKIRESYYSKLATTTD